MLRTFAVFVRFKRSVGDLIRNHYQDQFPIEKSHKLFIDENMLFYRNIVFLSLPYRSRSEVIGTAHSPTILPPDVIRDMTRANRSIAPVAVFGEGNFFHIAEPVRSSFPSANRLPDEAQTSPQHRRLDVLFNLKVVELTRRDRIVSAKTNTIHAFIRLQIAQLRENPLIIIH